MSEIKYGLISETDARCLEKTIDLICEDFYGEDINITEIGVYSGLTSKGLYEYVTSKEYATSGSVDFDSENFNFNCNYTGIDNNKDGEEIIHFPKQGELIIGNSNEVYNQIPDGSQHLIFIDALHTFPAVVADFFCYAPKVKKGGYLAFHDTGKHLDPLSQWQGVGDKNDPDFCLGGVRKALEAIRLIDFNGASGVAGWQLIWDVADINDTGGGITVFRKL